MSGIAEFSAIPHPLILRIAKASWSAPLLSVVVGATAAAA